MGKWQKRRAYLDYLSVGNVQQVLQVQKGKLQKQQEFQQQKVGEGQK